MTKNIIFGIYDMPNKKIHQGRNIKRFCKMLGIMMVRLEKLIEGSK